MVLALLNEQPDHGYGLLQRLSDQYGREISDGSLYPALYRLERADQITGTWEISDNGRKRKVFRLTDRGRKKLRDHRAEWAHLIELYSHLLGTTQPKASH